MKKIHRNIGIGVAAFIVLLLMLPLFINVNSFRPKIESELSNALSTRTIDAFGANRQRLTTLSKATPGTRLLPDDLFNVPQNIVVAKDRPTALAAINALIDEVRLSGFLQSAIERGGAIGVAVAPPGMKAGCPE